jgi:hypothetical protein
MPIDSCLSSGAIQSLAVGGANNRATVVDAHNTRDPSAHGMSLDGAPGKIFEPHTLLYIVVDSLMRW